MPSINIDMNWVYVAIVFIFAALLQQLVFIVTGSVHKVSASEGNEFTCLSFYHEQSRFAAVNFFVNVLAPNAVFVALYVLLLKLEMEQLSNVAFLVIPFYYFYRWCAILISLRERELFKARYELLYFVCGVGMGVAAARFIRMYNKTWSFTLEFWRDKLWAVGVIAAFLLIFLFLLVFSKKGSVITEGMLAEYIARRFEKLYNKYKDFTIVDAEKAPCWVFLYAIAIFEGLGGKKRKRINRKNINLVFDRIENGVFGDGEDDPTDEKIYEYALKYHNDKKYAKSIAFIHYFLKRFIEIEPFYYSIFCVGYKSVKDKVKEQEEAVKREVAECLAEQMEEEPEQEQKQETEPTLLDFDIFNELEVEMQPEKEFSREPIRAERVAQDTFVEQILDYVSEETAAGTKKSQDININLNVTKEGKENSEEYITLLRAARRADMMSEDFLKKMRRENVPIMFKLRDVEFYFKHRK
jgi:hypothetical protein